MSESCEPEKQKCRKPEKKCNRCNTCVAGIITLPRLAPGSFGTPITIGPTITGPPGSDADVDNIGTPTAPILVFTIPQGEDGLDGTDGTDGIDGTNGINGTNGTNGAAATFAIGTTTTLAPGSPATAANGGTPNAAIINLGIPAGLPGTNGTNGTNGTAATFTIGTTTTLPPGSPATAANSGTPNAAIIDLGIPEGQPGTPGGIAESGSFFALMPPNNAATVAPGAGVEFPQLGPAIGTGITALTATTFQLAAIGTYFITYQVPVDEAGQLVVTENGLPYAQSAAGRATGVSPISNSFQLTTSVINTVISVINPAGNPTALTITPNAGGTIPVSATLNIVRWA